MRFFSKVIGLVFVLGLSGCGYIDDYFLGKDNTLAPKPLPVIQPKILLNRIWTAKIGKAHQSHLYYKLKPVALGKKIYTADTSGRVSVLSSKGQILWTTPLPNGLVSGPSVGSHHVIVGTDKGTLVALSPVDGHLIWEVPLSGEILAKSTITQKLVIAKTIDGHLYALDLATGKQIWAIEHGTPSLVLKASSSPLIVGNTALVGYSDGKLDAVDIQNGRVLWQRGIVYSNGASDVERLVDIDADPMMHNHLIYLASYQGFIGAFDPDSGQFAWSKPASVYKNMAMDSEALYVTDSHDVLWAYNLASGQVKWKQTILKANGLTEPVLIGNRVIVGDKNGYLHILAKSNGELIGREKIGSPIYISPAVSDDRIMVMTADGVFHVYHLQVAR